jgi:hypothetical protein
VALPVYGAVLAGLVVIGLAVIAWRYRRVEA